MIIFNSKAANFFQMYFFNDFTSKITENVFVDIIQLIIMQFRFLIGQTRLIYWRLLTDSKLIGWDQHLFTFIKWRQRFPLSFIQVKLFFVWEKMSNFSFIKIFLCFLCRWFCVKSKRYKASRRTSKLHPTIKKQ